MKIAITTLTGVLIAAFSTVVAQDKDARESWSTHASLSASQVVSGDYFAAGEIVEISGTVNGDVYAFGGQVIIDGRVNGDVIVAGGKVNLSGTVSQDVRMAGGNVSIAGTVGRNLTVAGGNIELAPSAAVRGGLVAAGGSVDVAAPVSGSIKIAAGNLVLSSRIEGNIDAAVGTLRVTSKAEINGNVDYWSGKEASIAEGARIGGKIMRRVPPEGRELFPGLASAALAAWAMLVFISFVSTLVLGLLSARFLPGFHDSAVANLRERPWPSLGIGFVTVVVAPVVCALLFATIVAIPLALILLAAFFILLYWSRIFAISRIGDTILRRFRPAPGRTSAFVLGLFVYYLLAIIPVLGWIVILLAVLFGLGAELLARKQFYIAARRQEML
jgi:cytoskeletal protein CcmA (bactofilin family)